MNKQIQVRISKPERAGHAWPAVALSEVVAILGSLNIIAAVLDRKLAAASRVAAAQYKTGPDIWRGRR